MAPGEEINGWSDIPQELLEEILRKLTLVDYVKCRRVCRSWRRKVKDAVATKGACLPAPQFPLVMLLDGDLNKPATLLDITQKDTSYTIPIKTWEGYFGFDSVFSVQGWLVCQRTYYYSNRPNFYNLVLLYNPVSGEEFELPRWPLFPDQDLTFDRISVKLVFSSAPPDSADFFVVACATIHPTHPTDDENVLWRQQQLAFCKVTDKSWTPIPIDKFPSLPFEEFVIHDWKLYAMKPCFPVFFVTLFDLKDSSNIIATQNPVLIREIHREEVKGDYVNYRLAIDGDEIMLVAHLFSIETCLDLTIHWEFHRTKGFHLFKLDESGLMWIKADGLSDDRVLLIDCAEIQVMSAKKISLPRELSGGNCILFCMGNLVGPLIMHDLGVFALKDKRISHFPLTNSFSRSLWFMPSLW